jgi:nucleotidyltransferase/DNA polymerase involved in DNA repair
MSARGMTILQSLTPAIKVYSIDDASQICQITLRKPGHYGEHVSTAVSTRL